MKKILTGIFALLLCAAICSGCGAQTQPASSAAPETAADPAAETTEAAANAESADGYKILVTDEAGNPVSGASVQFCSDTECKMATTGADGIAAFDDPEGKYTVHILKAPDGFAADSTEYEVPEKYGTVTIVLKADGSGSSSEEEGPANLMSGTDCPEAGLHLDFPYADKKGIFAFLGSSLPSDKEDISIGVAWLVYIPLSPDDYEAFNAYSDELEQAEMKGEEPPTPKEERWKYSESLFSRIFTVISVTGDCKGDELNQLVSSTIQIELGDSNKLKEISKKGDTTFYILETKEEDPELKDIMGEFYDEYKAIIEDQDTFVSALTFSEPVPQEESAYEIPDGAISFETTDLDGNSVKSADLFKDHKVTMVNVWATWCGPCKGELEELGKLAKELEAKDCQLVGLCSDGSTAAEEAKTLLEYNHCEYLNIVASEDMEELLNTPGIPATFFFDSEGNMIAEPVIGAYVDQYPKVIEECLAAME